MAKSKSRARLHKGTPVEAPAAAGAPTAYKIRLSPCVFGLKMLAFVAAVPGQWFSPVTSHQSRLLLHKRGDAGNPLADHQLVNVVRALVCEHTLEIVHVPH